MRGSLFKFADLYVFQMYCYLLFNASKEDKSYNCRPRCALLIFIKFRKRVTNLQPPLMLIWQNQQMKFCIVNCESVSIRMPQCLFQNDWVSCLFFCLGGTECYIHLNTY